MNHTQNISASIKQLLIDTLSLDLCVADIDDDMLLLGNIPEFDSMAIVSIITALEESFDFVAEDDDLSAEVFESVQSLIDFVQQKIKAA
jgi:acyl carrier protein